MMMTLKSSSDEIFSPQSVWGCAREAILDHKYEKVIPQIPFEELLEASDRKICRVVKLILEQPFSEAGKSLVFTLLHGRESLFISQELVKQIASSANGTMRAQLLLWQCDTSYCKSSIKTFIHALFLGIFESPSQEIDASVFRNAKGYIRKNFNTIASSIKKHDENLIQIISTTQEYIQEK